MDDRHATLSARGWMTIGHSRCWPVPRPRAAPGSSLRVASGERPHRAGWCSAGVRPGAGAASRRNSAGDGPPA
jgi:hypothetical protein